MDVGIFNPSRIFKLYGTAAVKGDGTAAVWNDFGVLQCPGCTNIAKVSVAKSTTNAARGASTVQCSRPVSAVAVTA